MKLLRKKEIFKVKSIPIDPALISNPNTAFEYYQRGMAYYARTQYDLAIDDLKQAISLDVRMVDAIYCLGMVLKVSNRRDEAVDMFNRVVDLVVSEVGVGKASGNMLRRLALGHINMLTQGDWNLEKEIWKRTD